MWGIGSVARLRHCSRIQLAGTRHRSESSSAVKTSKNGPLEPPLMCSNRAPGVFMRFLSVACNVRRFHKPLDSFASTLILVLAWPLTGESKIETPAPWDRLIWMYPSTPARAKADNETLYPLQRQSFPVCLPWLVGWLVIWSLLQDVGELCLLIFRLRFPVGQSGVQRYTIFPLRWWCV